MASTMTEADALLAQWQGQIVPRSFNAGFVTLSYIVSLIGAGSTLELINRRTAPKGRINHLLLVTAAITMGGISIWSMHYIGNRAIDIGDGNPELQIAYSSGYTALSFFMPIIVLLAAFVAIGTNEQVSWWRVGVGGTLAGAAICGMHYLANASINNYECMYNAANVVGASLIAVAASIIALSLFFVYRASWTNSWWKRAMSAVLLAGAVSGMHWCASTGTRYRLLTLAGAGQLSRNTTVIVVICLSIGACIILAGFAIYTTQLMQRYANKAQEVVLAGAVFDKYGRVLVNPDGLLPSEKITDSFLEKTPQDSFTVAHPLFHWMFQASRNWSSITGIVGGITNHLSHLPHTQRNQTREGIKLITDHGELIENYEIIFRELFCAAASGLAEKMKTPLTSVGILWDEILATGGVGHAASIQARKRLQEAQKADEEGRSPRKDVALPESAHMASFEDVEKGIFRQQQQPHIQEFGRGSLMFLVRRVENAREVEGLTAAGYRFAELHQVSGIIGATMQIKTRSIENKLRKMATYAEENDMLEPGVHMAFFGIRARVNNDYGFDVLALRNARNLLPSVQMPVARLDPWQRNFLRSLERLTPHQIARRLDNAQSLTPREMMFASQITDCMEALRGSVEDSIFGESVLCSRTVEVPCRPVTPGSSPGTCTVITFRVVIPIHLTIESPKCEFVPLSLFKVHQLVYRDSPNHLVFSRSVHREIAPIINAVPLPLLPPPPKSASGHVRRSSLRDGRMASRIFRLGRPHASGGNGMNALDADGNLIPVNLHRRTSSGQSETSSTLDHKEYCRPGSGGEPSPASIMSGDTGFGSLPSPPPAYAMDELHLAASAKSPTTMVLPLPTPSLPQQLSSFGGIMVSQEITVNVQPAGDMSDASSGHGGRGNTDRYRPQAALRRMTSDGNGNLNLNLGAPGMGMGMGMGMRSSGEAKPVNRAEHFPGGPSHSHSGGIEMRPLAGDRTSVHIGTGVQVSNVEAEKLTELPTFVDELFTFCVEGR